MRFPQRSQAQAVSALAIACALLAMRAPAQTSFSEHTVYSGNAQLKIVGHGDFNNDGREDIVIAEKAAGTAAGGTMKLLLSNGDGTYDAPIALAASFVAPGQFAVGDFNHDGKLDFAALNVSAQYVEIWMGNGDGTFNNPDDLSTGVNPVGIAAADLNHDNSTDVIVVNAPGSSAAIQVWLSQGSTTVSFNGGQSITSGVIVPYAITTGDFDGDGKPDLALVDENNGPTTVQVFYGDGAGHLGSPTQLRDPGNYWDLWDVNAIGDIDGNGTSDLVMTQTMGGSSGTSVNYPRLAVFKGNTNRTLSLSTISTANGCPSTQIQVADYNGDGLNDLLYGLTPCSGSGAQNLVLNPATSKGVFSGSEQVIATSDQGGIIEGPPLVNLKSTQGTKPDLAFTQYAQSGASGNSPMSLSLLENTSTGSFPGCGTTAESEGIHLCVPGGSTATSPVKFSVSASGPTPMRTVAVWVDGQKVSEQLAHAFSNYSFLDQSVSLSAGSHSITIYGSGWDNTLQQKTFSLSVGSGTGCGAPSSPGVNVCKPVNGSTAGSPVEVQAAANITGTLARMEIWVDGTKMFSETTATSFDTHVSLANGYHRFDIYAVNTAGTKYESTVYATVGTPSSCAAPSSPGVHVCSPVNNSTVNSPVQATATATISGTLARMEVWVNGAKLYTETTSTSLSTPIGLGAGKYQFDFYAVNTLGTKWETTVYATVP